MGGHPFVFVRYNISNDLLDKGCGSMYRITNWFIYFYLFILMILMREGDTPEGASPKGLGWPLHREKKKIFYCNESRKSKPNSENWTILESSYEA